VLFINIVPTSVSVGGVHVTISEFSNKIRVRNKHLVY